MRRRWSVRHACLLLIVFLFLSASVDASIARVVRVEVDRRVPVLDGASMGPHGAYEWIEGRIYFAFDPAHPANARIVDLELAPRDENGEVRAWATLRVLQPADPEKRQGVALVEVSNRGGMFSMRYFNHATAPMEPGAPEALGDRLLLERGITMVWVGWQWDVPRGEERLRLHVPVARHPDGSAIHGLVRSDWVVSDTTDVLPLAHRNHVPYPAGNVLSKANTLTVRSDRNAPRRLLPRDRWQFARRDSTGAVVPDSTHILLEGGFEIGAIYECVYRAQDPRVVGLGLAAIRDVISYAKYDTSAEFPVDVGVAVGVSQTGRFLRHFLYQGFNTDEQDRPAYDGVLAITAGGGRGSFNHRFAQPSRDAHRFSAFAYPTDIFPFTSRTQFDALQWRSDGLLARQRTEHLPAIMQVNTGYEYWGRAASLLHTTPDGTADVAPHGAERIYHIASAQHFPWRFPPPEANRLQDAPALYRGNPMDHGVVYRALLMHMFAWVQKGTLPPPSRYPSHADGTLVPIDRLAFPSIPGVAVPEVVHTAHRADYGSRFRTDGVVTRQPPRLGPSFGMRVPQVDTLGNERGSVRTVAVRVPLATYMPWNLRTDAATNADELTDFYGSVAPLPADADAKAETGDPRPAVSALYPSRSAYLQQVEQAANRMIDDGFLLTNDRDRVLARAAALWDWVQTR